MKSNALGKIKKKYIGLNKKHSVLFTVTSKKEIFCLKNGLIGPTGIGCKSFTRECGLFFPIPKIVHIGQLSFLRSKYHWREGSQ